MHTRVEHRIIIYKLEFGCCRREAVQHEVVSGHGVSSFCMGFTVAAVAIEVNTVILIQT